MGSGSEFSDDFESSVDFGGGTSANRVSTGVKKRAGLVSGRTVNDRCDVGGRWRKDQNAAGLSDLHR